MESREKHESCWPGKGFEESTGSLWGRVVAVSAPGTDVWASSCVGCDLPGSYQCGEICSGDIPMPCCCCRALGTYLLYTQRKRLLVSLFTPYCLITLCMRPPPFIFILGFDSVQFVPETGLAGSSSVIFGGSVASFLLFLMSLHTIFCCCSLSAKHILSLASLSNIVYN